jgi:hypothetical protein
MDYKNKYLKYKLKYQQLKSKYIGGNPFLLPDTIIKGPNYLCHLKLEDKNIYLFGETHKNLSDITCGDSSKTMLDWLNIDVIPKYTEESLLDIFIEKPYLLHRNFEEDTEEDKEDRYKKILENDQTLDKLVTLIVKPTKNTRIHTIDIRNEISPILGRLSILDAEIKYLFFNMPQSKEYISVNHKILLNCLDIVIEWSFLMFFDTENRIIVKEKLYKIIKIDLLKYITDLQKFDLHWKFVYNFIDIKKVIEYLLLDVDFLPVTDFKFSDKVMRDELIQAPIFSKIYDKIDDKYKAGFLELNRELFSLKDQFFENYKKFKDSFNDKISIPNIPREGYLENFEKYNLFPEFENIEMICELLNSYLAFFVDVYTIGRLLKPYVKSCIVYTGLSHTKNLNNKLQKIFRFEKKYENTDINSITWEIFLDNSLDCVNLKNFNLFIS